MFHLTTHAFFKALLFLGSGSVIHGCHHEQDIFRMGGLGRRMRLTFATFSVGVAAIIGLPFLAGFFSKDAILFLAFVNNRAVFAILSFTAILTALYMVRLWKLVFLGAPRSPAADRAHEGGPALTVPLVVLAILAILGGYGILYRRLAGRLALAVPEAEGPAHLVILATSLVVLALGAGLALVLYRPAATDALEEKAPGLFGALTSLRELFDAVYGYYVGKIQQRLAILLNFLEQVLLSGLIIRGFSGLVGLFGLGARALHVGSLHAYVYWFLIGAVLLWAYAAGVF